MIHVMSEATEELVAPLFPLPASRVLRVSHPALIGVYPDWVGQAEARHVLGIGPTAPAIGLVGALKPYKGVEELLDALPRVAERRPGIRVVIAGRADPGPAMDALVDRAIGDPRVLIHPRHVPDDRIQHILRGVDVVVLPYRRVLNSATLHLALGFERPVVIPRVPALREFFDPAVAATYEPGSTEALAEAIDQALSIPSAGVSPVARRMCADRDPAIVSRAFVDGLRTMLAG